MIGLILKSQEQQSENINSFIPGFCVYTVYFTNSVFYLKSFWIQITDFWVTLKSVAEKCQVLKELLYFIEEEPWEAKNN